MYIVRLHRQHASVVMTVPKLVREALDIKAGDYVGMRVSEVSGCVQLTKVTPEAIRDGRDRATGNRQDKGGSL